MRGTHWLALAALATVGAGVAWRLNEASPAVRLTAAAAAAARPAPPQVASRPPPPPPPSFPAHAPLPASLVKQDQPLSVLVAQLMASERPEDAYAAYLMVAGCTAHNAGHGPALIHDEQGGQRPMQADERKRMDRMCGSMTERERQARLDYLAAAAKGGVPGAAWQYLSEGPFGDPSALKTRPNDPLVLEWKARATAQVERAAEGGDAAALLIWGLQKLHGSELATPDPQLGYGYLLAIGLVAAQQNGANDMTARVYREGSEQMNAFSAALSQQQRAAALALARRIADQAARAR